MELQRHSLKEVENRISLNSSSIAKYDNNDNLIATITEGDLSTKRKDIFVVENLWIDKNNEDELILSMQMDTYKFKNLDKKKEFEISMMNNYLGITVCTTAREVILAIDDEKSQECSLY